MDQKTLWAVVIVVIILVGAGAYLAARKGGGAEQGGAAGGQGEVKTVQIVALLPLTGGLQSFGKANSEAIKLAERDVNQYLAKEGANFRINVTIVDTQTNPEIAKQKFDSYYSKGVRYFIGPMSSSELAKIVSLIHAGKKAVVISQSSTAPNLAQKDTVFRFPPPDEFQGKVLAALYQIDGVTHIIIVYRNDDWGNGLAGYVKSYFTQAGGNVVDMIPYDKEATDFTPVMEKVKSDVESLIQQGVDPSKIGVELISFEEAASILSTAAGYDVLKQVKWYGSDGTALSQTIVQNEQAASFAAQVHWKNTITFSVTNKTGEVYCALEQKLGYPPDPYSLIAYDAVWVMALAIEKAGGANATPDQVAQMIPVVTQSYVGVSGKIVLNEYGDRAGSDYGIFEIVKKGDHYEWTITELYKFETGEIVPVTQNPLQCG